MKSRKVIGPLVPREPRRKPLSILEKVQSARDTNQRRALDAAMRLLNGVWVAEAEAALTEIWGPGAAAALSADPQACALVEQGFIHFQWPPDGGVPAVIRQGDPPPAVTPRDSFVSFFEPSWARNHEACFLLDFFFFNIATPADRARLVEIVGEAEAKVAIADAQRKAADDLPPQLRNLANEPEQADRVRALLLEANKTAPFSWMIRHQSELTSDQEKWIDEWRVRFLYSTAPGPALTIQ